MSDNYRLTVAFCATNESKSLNDTFEKISQYNYASEYIFTLSTNATDSCLKTVEAICKNPKCRYIFQKRPGLGNAIRNTIEESAGTHLIIWPADDGMDTKAFPEMVRLSKENTDSIVSVSRWLIRNGFEGYGKIRKVLNFISQKLFAALYKSNLTDFTNPTQIAPLEIYRSINWEGTEWDFIPEMIFKPLKLGYKFIEVPCKNFVRKDGKSHSSFFKLAEYYLIILKIYLTSDDKLRKRNR